METARRARANARLIFVSASLLADDDLAVDASIDDNSSNEPRTTEAGTDRNAARLHQRYGRRRRMSSSTRLLQKKGSQAKSTGKTTSRGRHHRQTARNAGGGDGAMFDVSIPVPPLKYADEPVLLRLWRSDHRRLADINKNARIHNALLEIRHNG